MAPSVSILRDLLPGCSHRSQTPSPSVPLNTLGFKKSWDLPDSGRAEESAGICGGGFAWVRWSEAWIRGEGREYLLCSPLWKSEGQGVGSREAQWESRAGGSGLGPE